MIFKKQMLMFELHIIILLFKNWFFALSLKKKKKTNKIKNNIKSKKIKW